MKANESRLVLQMARELMTGRQSGDENVRRLRKWMQWEGKEDWSTLLKLFERLGTSEHGEFRRALSNGQIESKLWLIDVLSGILPRDRAYRFTVVGGWLGTLPYLMYKLAPGLVESITQLDLNPETNRIAEQLNEGAAFSALDRDALGYDYDDQPDVIINTSCEHFSAQEIKLWLQRLPAGRFVVLQSNDFFNEPGHLNCHHDVFEFRNSLDLNRLHYTGILELEKYNRFMVAGTSRGF